MASSRATVIPLEDCPEQGDAIARPEVTNKAQQQTRKIGSSMPPDMFMFSKNALANEFSDADPVLRHDKKPSQKREKERVYVQMLKIHLRDILDPSSILF